MTVSPAFVVAFAVVWAVTVFLLRYRRRWLVYYITAAFGFILLVVMATKVTGWQNILEALEASQVKTLSGLTGLSLDVLGGSGLAIPNHTGWAVFDIGIECSALLEMSAIIGLIGFYPAFRPGRRAANMAIGLAVTYVMNLARIMLIVAIINAYGTAWVFPAHAVFGRVFFFIATIALYWYLITRPTVSIVNR
ncbi:MAG: hypothetical protein U1E22_03505, partial [Coriobacteriia bacterium]|nr:hypothetical protein [Coriobacteriia bacterium]